MCPAAGRQRIGRTHKRFLTALGAAALALGGVLVAPSAAQASAPTYRCQSATLHTILANQPVIGHPCTGPVGTQPPGAVLDESTSQLYSCYYLDAWESEGGLYVFGSNCEAF